MLDELQKTSALAEGRLKDLYIESKILELIHLSFKDAATHNNSTLSHREVECLHKAKDLLLENFQNPPSIKELAYKSAINEFALKKGFKQLFGTTVYGMLRDYRLEYAKKVLEKNDINVQEAALMVGYKSMGTLARSLKIGLGFCQ